MTLLLSFTHPQSLAFARYSEIPTTTLLTVGPLTFRGLVSTFWQKTAPPLPRPFRCWWRTMRAGPAPSPGPSRWTWCWVPAPSASSSTWRCAGTARALRCPARRRSFTSTWMATSWKWRPKQVGLQKHRASVSLRLFPLPRQLAQRHHLSSWGLQLHLLHGGKPGGRRVFQLQASPHPHSPGLWREIWKLPQKYLKKFTQRGALLSDASHTSLAICWHPVLFHPHSKNSSCALWITSFSCFVAILGHRCPTWNCQCVSPSSASNV